MGDGGGDVEVEKKEEGKENGLAPRGGRDKKRRRERGEEEKERRGRGKRIDMAGARVDRVGV